MRAIFSGLIFAIISFVPAAQAAEYLRESIAKDYDENLREMYFHFHRNPELSNLESETVKRLAAEIRVLGYEVTEGVGGTGIVAVLKNGSGPTVMIRADMDGLPVKEQSGLDYASQVTQVDESVIEQPVMHAVMMYTSQPWWAPHGKWLNAVKTGQAHWC